MGFSAVIPPEPKPPDPNNLSKQAKEHMNNNNAKIPNEIHEELMEYSKSVENYSKWLELKANFEYSKYRLSPEEQEAIYVLETEFRKAAKRQAKITNKGTKIGSNKKKSKKQSNKMNVQQYNINDFVSVDESISTNPFDFGTEEWALYWIVNDKTMETAKQFLQQNGQLHVEPVNGRNIYYSSNNILIKEIYTNTTVQHNKHNTIDSNNYNADAEESETHNNTKRGIYNENNYNVKCNNTKTKNANINTSSKNNNAISSVDLEQPNNESTEQFNYTTPTNTSNIINNNSNIQNKEISNNNNIEISNNERQNNNDSSDTSSSDDPSTETINNHNNNTIEHDNTLEDMVHMSDKFEVPETLEYYINNMEDIQETIIHIYTDNLDHPDQILDDDEMTQHDSREDLLAYLYPEFHLPAIACNNTNSTEVQNIVVCAAAPIANTPLPPGNITNITTKQPDLKNQTDNNNNKGNNNNFENSPAESQNSLQSEQHSAIMSAKECNSEGKFFTMGKNTSPAVAGFSPLHEAKASCTTSDSNTCILTTKDTIKSLAHNDQPFHQYRYHYRHDCDVDNKPQVTPDYSQQSSTNRSEWGLPPVPNFYFTDTNHSVCPDVQIVRLSDVKSNKLDFLRRSSINHSEWGLPPAPNIPVPVPTSNASCLSFTPSKIQDWSQTSSTNREDWGLPPVPNIPGNTNIPAHPK